MTAMLVQTEETSCNGRVHESSAKSASVILVLSVRC
jgi:hypothetical protein